MIPLTDAFLIALLWAVCIFLLVCPPKWDPAILWKERRERKERQRWERLQLEIHLGINDMMLKDGKTTCALCGAYCGQCGNASMMDLDAQTYRERFMK